MPFFTSRTICLGFLIGLSAFGARAASLTNVLPVNVTPTSFSVVWRAAASIPNIHVFADPTGATNLSAQLSIEPLPLHTGSPDATDSYLQRRSQFSLREKTRAASLAMVKVTGCLPNTTYYYRVESKSADGSINAYPQDGTLLSVKTAKQNTFVVNNQQLLVEVPGLDTAGQIALLTHPAAAHPLAAVVGDGAGTNQVFFELNNLFEAAGAGGNFAPIGTQNFDLAIKSSSPVDVHAQFSVTFGTNFTSGVINQGSLGTEFVACSLGNAVVRVGAPASVGVSFNASTPLKLLELKLTIPPGRLGGFGLADLIPELDPLASVANLQDGTNLTLRFQARSGQAFMGNRLLGKFAFSASTQQDSAFTPLVLREILAFKPDNSTVKVLFGSSGRAVVVGHSSLLEGAVLTNGARTLMLYGKPFSSYALEFATDVNKPTWTRMGPMAITNLATPLVAWNAAPPGFFYRAVEFFADPPLLQPEQRPDGLRWVTLFGKPGSTYSIQSAQTFSVPMVWTEVGTASLTNSFASVLLPSTTSQFYRVQESTVTPAPSPAMTVQEPQPILETIAPGVSSYRIEVSGEHWKLQKAISSNLGKSHGRLGFEEAPDSEDPEVEETVHEGLPVAVNQSSPVWEPVIADAPNVSFAYRLVGHTNGTAYYMLERR